MLKIIFVTYLITIFYLSVSSQEVEVVKNSWDKLNHLGAFFVLYILLSFAYKKIGILSKFIISLSFGFFIEIVQYFLPYRDFSLFDILADILGILLGILFLKVFSSVVTKFLKI